MKISDAFEEFVHERNRFESRDKVALLMMLRQCLNIYKCIHLFNVQHPSEDRSVNIQDI